MITKEAVAALPHLQEVFYALPKSTRHITCLTFGKFVQGAGAGFSRPVRIGANGQHNITESNAVNFHIPGTCPCQACGK